MRGTATLAQRFDARRNSFNALRLALAASVIVWHAFPVTGRVAPLGLGEGRLGDIGVDGFFAISGFLIARSWVGRPQLGRYLWHRVLRIMPGFWVVLLVTIAVFAPLSVLLQGGSLHAYVAGDPGRYFTANWWLAMPAVTVAGTPRGTPRPEWNASLWTLYWEALCYLGIVLAAARRRPVILLAAFAAFWLLALLWAVEPARIDGWRVNAGPLHLHPYAARFGLMFCSGALVLALADRLPCSRRWAAGAALIVVAALCFSTQYRLFAAPAVAYLMVWLAIALPPRFQGFWRGHDFSYGAYIYGFPVQQLLVIAGAGSLGYAPFALLSLVAVAPFAVASWFGVERPALRLKAWRPRRLQPAFARD